METVFSLFHQVLREAFYSVSAIASSGISGRRANNNTSLSALPSCAVIGYDVLRHNEKINISIFRRSQSCRSRSRNSDIPIKVINTVVDQ